MLAYRVNQRQREFGVRVALGSTTGQIRSLVLLDALKPTLIGVGFGWLGAWLSTKYVASLLYRVDVRDVPLFALSGGVLILATLVATIVPHSQSHRHRPDPLTASGVELDS